MTHHVWVLYFFFVVNRLQKKNGTSIFKKDCGIQSVDISGALNIYIYIYILQHCGGEVVLEVSWHLCFCESRWVCLNSSQCRLHTE